MSTIRDLAAPVLAPGTTVDLGSLAKRPELKTFASAAKKIEKMIASLEAGGDPDEQLSKEAHAVSMAINKLDDRTNHAYPADGQADAPRQPTSSLSFQPARPSGVGGAA